MTRVILFLCISFGAWAQNPTPDPQTLQNLLAEVHQLRLALEHSSKIAPRIQIAVERIKMQQDQVARTARQLEDVRHEIEHRQSEQPRLQQQLESLESHASTTTDPSQRRELEDVLKMQKVAAEQGQKSLQQVQAREGELASQLQSEQSRLTELNDRLDQLERALNQ